MKKISTFILAVLLLLGMLAGCAKNPEGIRVQNTKNTQPPSSQTASSMETGNSQLEASASGATESGAAALENTLPHETLPQETLPEETVPGNSTSPGGDGQIFSMEELQGMDRTRRTYGPGTQVDGDNRPLGAITLQEWYGEYDAYFIAPDNGEIYLTFDEGYENGYTAQILDVLKEKRVRAVFFVTMPYCKKNPELIQRMIDEGHTVGSHSVSHKSMPTLQIEEMIDEVMVLHDYVLEHFDYEMKLFRPPMGEYSKQSLAVLQNLGYKTVEWSFAYVDYDTENQPDPDKAYEKVVGAAHGGGIFLLHAVSKTNAEILGDVIEEFRRQGYTLELFE